MKKNQNLGRSLTKSEQKRVMGGDGKDPGGGSCYACYWNGMSSCWYSTTGCADVCQRVYGHTDACVGPSECGGCVLN